MDIPALPHPGLQGVSFGISAIPPPPPPPKAEEGKSETQPVQTGARKPRSQHRFLAQSRLFTDSLVELPRRSFLYGATEVSVMRD